MNILTIEVILKLSNIFFKKILAMHQIMSIGMKRIRAFFQTSLNSVLAYFHYSNFDITFIVMNMPTIEVIMKISNNFLQIYRNYEKRTLDNWCQIDRNLCATSLNSVLDYFHNSNFNIICIAINMPTIRVIMILSNLFSKFILVMKNKPCQLESN